MQSMASCLHVAEFCMLNVECNVYLGMIPL